MNLVLFTNTYPYGHDETFVSNELRVAENKFERIYIVCGKAGNKDYVQFVPQNGEVIERMENLSTYLPAICSLFSLSTIRDIWYSGHVLKQKVNVYTFKKMIDAKIKFFAGRRLAKQWVNNNDCIVYSYWLNGVAWAAISFGKTIKSKSLVARTHGADCFLARGYQPFRREMLCNLNAVYSVSTAGAEEITSKILPTIKNAVDYADIRIGYLGVFGGKRNPENRCEALVIVTCSHIIPLKRLDLLIDSLEIIKETLVKWVHFGDGAISEQVKQYAADKLGSKPNIEYCFMGKVANKTIKEFYESEHIDLFVNCSDYEGLPVSIMEAMSHGIPVLARDVGGNREIVTPDSGWLIEKDAKREKITSIIESLNAMPDADYSALRESTYENWQAKFSAEENYNRFYNEIMTI